MTKLFMTTNNIDTVQSNRREANLAHQTNVKQTQKCIKNKYYPNDRPKLHKPFQALKKLIAAHTTDFTHIFTGILKIRQITWELRSYCSNRTTKRERIILL